MREYLRQLNMSLLAVLILSKYFHLSNCLCENRPIFNQITFAFMLTASNVSNILSLLILSFCYLFIYANCSFISVISLFIGLIDEQQKVRTITALAIAALAEAATPYGIESFDSVLKPLWKGIRQHRGKVRVIQNLYWNILKYEHTQTHTYKHTHKHEQTQTNTHIHKQKQTHKKQTQTITNQHTNSQTHIHIHKHRITHFRIRTYMDTHTRTNESTDARLRTQTR